MSDPCPSTSRSWHQPVTQRKASRRPLNRTVTTNNPVLRWHHHCTHRREEQVQNDRRFYHSERENLMSSSSQDPTSTRKLVAVFSGQKRLKQDTFSDRDEFPLGRQQVFESDEPFIRFSNPANVAKSHLDGNRDHLLVQARSERMKQEYKVESLNTCISEFQQQTYAQRLELEDAHHGYVESRREQVRLQEEFSHERESTSRHSD